MLTAEAQSRLAVVLVGARNPQNIGAAARAMRDLGFSDLRIVNEFAPPFEAAQLEAKSAVAAEEIMRDARRFDELPQAIADCSLVVGTTAIGGRGLTQTVYRLQTAAPFILDTLRAESSTESTASENAEPSVNAGAETSSPRVALLFGSEKTGLTNEQLSFCSLLLTIPMFAPEGRHLSMNLGQAVAVCLYEIARDGFQGARDLASPSVALATAEDRERLLLLLQETMERSDYSRRFPANARTTVTRRLVAMLATGKEEATTWMGLLKMINGRLAGARSALPQSAKQQE